MKTFPILCRAIGYAQGQYRGRIREYFYYIDHNGMLFLDDSRMKNFTSCFKDKKFLTFFFRRLKVNTGQYAEEFPYVSPCGIEQNYVRVDDLPIVFTKLSDEDTTEALLEVNGSDITFPFDPAQIYMKEDNGRIYHTGPEKLHSVGLMSSKLAIQLSSRFVNEDGFYKYFKWNDKLVKLSNQCLEKLQVVDAEKSKSPA